MTAISKPIYLNYLLFLSSLYEHKTISQCILVVVFNIILSTGKGVLEEDLDLEYVFWNFRILSCMWIFLVVKVAGILQSKRCSSPIGTFPRFLNLLSFLLIPANLSTQSAPLKLCKPCICSIKYDLFGILVCSNIKPASLNLLNLGKWDWPWGP